MSHREVAMNKNFRHGDAMCATCRTCGPPQALAQGFCPLCHRRSCVGCREGGPESSYDGPHAKCVRAARGVA